MDPIDVPVVTKLPDPDPNETDVVGFTCFILTQLIASAPAMVHAESHPSKPTIAWHLRHRSAMSDLKEVTIATSPSPAIFRAVLARIGHHCMNDQLYRGFATPTLRQNNQTFQCTIFMSNTGTSDFWIRVYLHAFDKSEATRA
jgi:hypothetical protein